MKNKHFLIASAMALTGMVLIFNVGSAFADKHNINSVFAIVGALLTASAVGWIAYRYVKSGGNPNRG